MHLVLRPASEIQVSAFKCTPVCDSLGAIYIHFYNGSYFPCQTASLCKHPRNNLKRGDSVTDSKFGLQDSSHSLVSEKTGCAVRNVPFWCCVINCAAG